MNDDKNKGSEYEKAFGLDMSLQEAVARFGQATKDELEDLEGARKETVTEGEFHLIPFKGKQVRKQFHNDEWWFSVVDVVGAVAETDRARKYWADLKRQLTEKEGFSELSDKIGQLPMPGADGKNYPTDVANTETTLRIIQSIPSKNAEPFKRWLAKVGYERIQEAQDPEIAIKRAIFHYQLQGRSDDWIEKRIRSIVVRKELTGEWKKRGVSEEKEYAILTNVISAATFGTVTNEGHKLIKGLKKHHNLRDHMTDLELIFTMLGEKSTTEIARSRDAQGFLQNRKAAAAGGVIAGTARAQLEKETGVNVVSPSNFLGIKQRAADPQQLTDKAK